MEILDCPFIKIWQNNHQQMLAYNDYAQLFDLYPLLFHGNFQENSPSEVPWIYPSIISLIKQISYMQL